MISRATLASSFLRTLVLDQVLSNRARLARWQRWNLERLRRHALSRVPFYRALGTIEFADFPIVSKSDVMARFEDFNCTALSAQQAWDMVDAGTAPPGFDVGCSTGTSGNRGLYLISDSERFLWLGTILAKALPDVLISRHRVAIMLPRSSRLYAAANESRLLTLKFLDLGHGFENIATDLVRLQPSVLVGPPKVLRWLAEHAVPIKPSRLFSSAEVLDPPDRQAIEKHFGQTLGQIYMATEGLFGVSCRLGTLHLAEDVVAFELEPVDGEPGLVSPIVTDFTRRVQIMARYRMNDLLRLDPNPCRCGSPLQAVAEVVGRRDDIFRLPRTDGLGAETVATPDILRNAVLGSDRSIMDFRVIQATANGIEIQLPLAVDRAIGETARLAVLHACQRLGASPQVRVTFTTLAPGTGVKLRRVENRWAAVAR